MADNEIGKTFRELHGEPVEDTSDEPFVYHGEELTDERSAELEERASRAFANLVPGGKSLSGGSKHSPTVQFRVPESLRGKLVRQASSEGVSPSKLARKALEEYLAK